MLTVVLLVLVVVVDVCYERSTAPLFGEGIF